MKLNYVVGRLSRLVFLIAFFNISISFAGFLFVCNFSEKLGFNLSLFDVNFYDFFYYVVIADKFKAFAAFIIFSIFSISITLYPKSIIFIFNIVKICFFQIWYFFVTSRFLLVMLGCYIIPLLILPFASCVLIGCLVYLSIHYFKKYGIFNKYLVKVKNKLNKNTLYKESLKILDNSDGQLHFINSYLVFCFVLAFFIIWFSWAIHIGQQGEKRAEALLNSKSYKTIYLANKTQGQGVFISKVKNGYLFVLNENGKNNKKATFISDSAILRID